jgi:hypothetical protein
MNNILPKYRITPAKKIACRVCKTENLLCFDFENIFWVTIENVLHP